MMGKRSPVVPLGDIFAVGLQSRSFPALADSITQISKGTKEIPQHFFSHYFLHLALSFFILSFPIFFSSLQESLCSPPNGVYHNEIKAAKEKSTLFWFTESLFSPLIADTNLTIQRGGVKKTKENQPNQTKPKEEREALASALWNSSHMPPSFSFVPLSVMLRNRRPLKSALMRPKRHSSLLSPLPWSFWRSGFGSHTHTQPHQHRPTRSWRTGCIRVVSAATLVPAFGRLLKFSGGL